jgi:hypothetical protein
MHFNISSALKKSWTLLKSRTFGGIWRANSCSWVLVFLVMLHNSICCICQNWRSFSFWSNKQTNSASRRECYSTGQAEALCLFRSINSLIKHTCELWLATYGKCIYKAPPPSAHFIALEEQNRCWFTQCKEEENGFCLKKKTPKSWKLWK